MSDFCNYFVIIGKITDIEIVASGTGIHDISHLRKEYGDGNWRKLKGKALVRLRNGRTRKAEVHWYESHGIGKKKLKIKCYLD